MERLRKAANSNWRMCDRRYFLDYGTLELSPEGCIGVGQEIGDGRGRLWVQSLCCTTEINTALYINHTSIKKKKETNPCIAGVYAQKMFVLVQETIPNPWDRS